MPVTMLDGGSSATMPRLPLRIGVQPATGLVIEVRTDPDGGTVVRQPQLGLVVLPAVGAPAVVVVRSVDGRPFPATAVVSVDVVAGAAASSDPDRAVLSQVRLGGLIERELVIVTGSGTQLTVRAAGEASAEVDLGRLGNAARAAASALLGAARVPEDDALNVVVAVDRSASFRPRVEDGSLAAVTAVLNGVAATVVRDQRLAAALVGVDVTWIDAPRLGAAMADRVRATTPTSAFRSGSSALAAFDPDRNTLVYLVTDAVPGDLSELEAAEEKDGQGRHVVALCPESVLRAGRGTALPTTAIQPGPDLEDRLLADPAALAELVRSLLRGCFAPGSHSFERLAS